MRKDVSVCVPVDDKIFNPAETDYREMVIDQLMALLAQKSPDPAFDEEQELKEFLADDDSEEVEAEAQQVEDEEAERLILPDLQDVTVKEAKNVIDDIEDTKVLRALHEQERKGKDRKGVLEAIETQIVEVESDD